jgi:hypothetical protein
LKDCQFGAVACRRCPRPVAGRYAERGEIFNILPNIAPISGIVPKAEGTSNYLILLILGTGSGVQNPMFLNYMNL